jgi:hypothetical protein
VRVHRCRSGHGSSGLTRKGRCRSREIRCESARQTKKGREKDNQEHCRKSFHRRKVRDSLSFLSGRKPPKNLSENSPEGGGVRLGPPAPSSFAVHPAVNRHLALARRRAGQCLNFPSGPGSPGEPMNKDDAKDGRSDFGPVSGSAERLFSRRWRRRSESGDCEIESVQRAYLTPTALRCLDWITRSQGAYASRLSGSAREVPDAPTESAKRSQRGARTCGRGPTRDHAAPGGSDAWIREDRRLGPFGLAAGADNAILSNPEADGNWQ